MRSFNIKNFVKNNIFILVLFVLSIISFHGLLIPSNVLDNVHYINDVTFYSYNLEKSLKEGSLPLWTPFYYSGRPLFAQPEYHFIDMNFILILLTGNINLAMNYSVIFYFFIAGLGMYLLCHYILKDKQASFIAAFLYMFNSFTHSFVVPGNMMILEGYSLIPLFFLFMLKTFREHEFVFNSVVAGILVCLLVFSGGLIFFPYIFIIAIALVFIYLPGENFRKRLVKYSICSAIILVLGLGLSAVKLLPGIEFMDLSNRGSGIPYQEYLGEPIKLKNFGYAFVSSVFLKGDHISASIGLAGFALLLFGVSRIKNRAVFFSSVVIILSLLLSTESFVTKFLFNVPVFNQVRHIERAIFLFAFAAPILAAFGFVSMRSYAAHRRIGAPIFLAGVIVLAASELYFMQDFPGSKKIVAPKDIAILDYMSKDGSYFRTVNEAMSTLIGASGYNYYSQEGIGEVKGGGGIWFDDYMEYLIFANEVKPKFWGVLNAKYVVMKDNASVSGLELVGKFDECLTCDIWEAYGPYLYENSYVVPRFYFVPKVHLIAGDKSKDIVYGLMSRNEWNPLDSAFLKTQRISSLSIDMLGKIDSVIITSNPDENEMNALKIYKSAGGRILPDIFSGKNSIGEDDLNYIYAKGRGVLEPNVKSYENNKVVIDVSGMEGWLIASERFAYFPGWDAYLDGNKIQVFSANNAVSAVYLGKGSSELIFEYHPDSYRKGKIVSIAFLVLLAVCFSWVLAKRFKGGGKSK